MIHVISNNIELFENPIYQKSTIEDVILWLDNNTLVEYDCETQGFEPLNCKMLSYQFGNFDNQFVIDSIDYPVTLFKHYFENPIYTWLGQNIKFDLKFLLHHNIDIWKMNVWDTFLAECILTTGMEERGLGLDKLVFKYCNYNLDKSIRGEIIYKGLTSRTVKYAAEDVMFLSKIREQQISKLIQENLLEVMELENNVTKVFSEMEYYGLKIDKDLWLEAANTAQTNSNNLFIELEDIVLNEEKLKSFKKRYTQESLFGVKERVLFINYDSPLQIKELIQQLGFKITSTNAKEIETINHPIIKKFINYKKQQKLVTTYGKGFLNNIRNNGTITTQYWQILATGRVSSGDKSNKMVNLQNLPAITEYRRPFITDNDDEVFIDADYTAIEAVIAAEVSNEEQWLKANNEGLDLHSINAEMTFNKLWKDAALDNCEYYISKQKCKCPEHKIMRDKVKTTTYLYLFGGGPNKLSVQLSISLNEAKTILTAFKKSVPNMEQIVKQTHNFVKRNLFIYTLAPYKRRRYFKNYNDMNSEDKASYIAEIERQSFNTLIQGSASNILKLALCYIKAKLVIENIEHKFRVQVHDQVIISTHKDNAIDVARIVKEEMIKAGEVVLKRAKLTAEIEITQWWKK